MFQDIDIKPFLTAERVYIAKHYDYHDEDVANAIKALRQLDKPDVTIHLPFLGGHPIISPRYPTTFREIMELRPDGWQPVFSQCVCSYFMQVNFLRGVDTIGYASVHGADHSSWVNADLTSLEQLYTLLKARVNE